MRLRRQPERRIVRFHRQGDRLLRDLGKAPGRITIRNRRHGYQGGRLRSARAARLHQQAPRLGGGLQVRAGAGRHSFEGHHSGRRQKRLVDAGGRVGNRASGRHSRQPGQFAQSRLHPHQRHPHRRPGGRHQGGQDHSLCAAGRSRRPHRQGKSLPSARGVPVVRLAGPGRRKADGLHRQELPTAAQAQAGKPRPPRCDGHSRIGRGNGQPTG